MLLAHRVHTLSMHRYQIYHRGVDPCILVLFYLTREITASEIVRYPHQHPHCVHMYIFINLNQ